MSTKQPLAIVGLGCRFPGGVTDPESYWQLLINRGSGITEIPADRWNWRKYLHPNHEVPGRMVTKWGGFLSNPDRFDAPFFGISPREAQRMDPQQRWLLETSWQALEDAGLPPASLRGSRTSVFVGISSHDYVDIQRGDTSLLDIHSGTGNALSIAANRISYLFDFRGPSVAVDTACSSALVATYLACQSLWAGECDLALAGGVNALFHPGVSIGFSKASMLSPDGRCFAFDHRANGYVRGEGVGVVVIKPLLQAESDGDRVYAVIRGAASNQDGHTSSLTVPGMPAQEAMLREAYQGAGISPSRVAYIETHGTGTPVGDPIEARALGHVLGADRSPEQPCLIGSVKTNIGHLETASGMAGLIKAALILQHQVIPPHLNFERANPNIPLTELGLEVVTEQRTLPQPEGLPAVVGVNSFGFGGTNAHIVLEQAALTPRADSLPAQADRPCLLPLSAANESALQAQAEAYLTFVSRPTDQLADIAAAAGTRREHFHSRLTVTARDAEEVRSRLRDYLNHPVNQPGLLTGQPVEPSQPPVFVFTGQGAQWWGMGRQLLEREPQFIQTVQAIDALFQPLSGWSLLAEMTRPEADSQIDRTDIAQPAIFALQVALAELWATWGLRPAKVIGHSVGEVAAAYVAGIYTLADAVKIIYHRSRLQNTTAGHGSMAAVGLSLPEAERAIAGSEALVQVGAMNSPKLVTLTGANESLDEILTRLEASGVFVRRLPINYAFHSYQMEPIREELLAVLADLQPQPGTIPFISTVTGETLPGQALDAAYWWDNVRQPVCFAPALTGLIQAGETTFLELGPHPALQNSIHDLLAEQEKTGQIFHSLRRETDESLELLNNLAALHLYGLPLDWAAINQSDGRFVRLPGYPWQRQTYWLSSDARRRYDLEPLAHPLLGMRLPAPQPTWEQQLDPRVLDYLNDHRIWDSLVFPGAGYGEIGLAVARILFPDDAYVVEALQIKKALFLSLDHLPTLQTVFDENGKTFSIYSALDEKKDWQLHAQGELRKLAPVEHPTTHLRDLRQRLTFLADKERYYQAYQAMGYQFGPNFQQIQNIWSAPGQALAEIVVGAQVSQQAAEYHFHPVLLDACFQSLSAAADLMSATQPGSGVSYLPAAFGRIQLLSATLPDHFWVSARVVDQNWNAITANFQVFDEHGALLAEILAGRFDRVKPNASASKTFNAEFYQFHWQAKRLKSVHLSESAQLTSVAEIVAEVERVRPALHQAHNLGLYFQEFIPRFETVTRQAIQNAWLELGWDFSIASQFSLEALMRRLGLIERYRPLVRVHLAALEQAGLIQAVEPEVWRVVQALAQANLPAQLDELAETYPQAASELELLRAIAPRLTEILRGRVDPMSLLFPDGSSRLLTTFYRSGGDQAVGYQLIQAAVRKAVEQLPSGRPLRVLELGAGTGALTAVILPVLPADRTEYTFTDISPKFLHEARHQFSAYPFIEYRPFDLTQPPAAQGLDLHGYDLVLAANTLHATPNLQQSLAHIAQCLAPNGLLVFLEVTRQLVAYNTIFGMFPDWWRQNPETNQLELALQARQQWEQLLEAGAYRQIGSFTNSPDENEESLSTFLALAPAFEAAPATETKTAPGTYLFLADQHGVASALAEALTRAGGRVITATAGEKFTALDNSHYLINPAEEAELGRLFAAIRDDEAPLAAILQAWGLDTPPIQSLSAEQLAATQENGVLQALRLTHALAAEKFTRSPAIVFLSRETQPVLETDTCAGLANAPLAGFLRVANNEYSTFKWQLIDLDPQPSEAEIESLLLELTQPDAELEVAYRQGQRYVNRLRQIKPETLPALQRNALPAEGEPLAYRLQINQPGSLSNLSLNETRRQPPGAQEIEVRVQAGGLNFRDVMKALGMYPGNPIDLTWLGDDFAGLVTTVGEQVTGLKPGDAVAGMAPYAFRSHLSVHQRAVFKIPAWLGFEEAATLPTVFLTAYYALVTLARMQPGERVLIHAATGGVGQAAIQIAQEIGLEIFATAGTPEKRVLLREQGVTQIFDSRSLNFADEILRVTGGRGVDAVLNSLAGDFIPKNFAVLAPFGRYLEIGKIDVYGNSKIGLEALRNNLSVFIIDLAQLMENRPAVFVEIFKILRQKFEQKVYRPLPHTSFPITEAVEAFRYMAAGKHVGKNVLSFQVAEIPVGRNAEAGQLFRPDASYLITGGAGGFGLEVAKWMTRQGARHLGLLTRSGPPDAAAREALEQLRAEGVTVLDLRGDVTLAADVERVVRELQNGPAPLAGVIHSAMVLNDQLLADLDEAGFKRAFHPKILGAWNLHQATLNLPLEHFICFSSISSMLGTTKQANYSAGNAFLDTLAYYRRARGLPALTLNWGILSGAGFMERHREMAGYLEAVGIKPLSTNAALQILESLLALDGKQVGVASVDWHQLSGYLAGIQTSVFNELARQDQSSQVDAELTAKIMAAAPSERLALVEKFLIRSVADVLGTDEAKIDPTISLSSLGLDSLMSIELIASIDKQLNLSLAVSDVLSSSTLQAVAAVILEKIVTAAELQPDQPVAAQASPWAGILDQAETQVDLSAEAQLDPAIYPQENALPPATPARAVLLTGATGFLGAFLLSDLLQHTSAEVYCLVRAATVEVAGKRLRENLSYYGLWDDRLQTRIKPVPGDLSQPRLGLSDQQFEQLAAEIDVIYQNGAVLNLLQPYAALKTVNVLGVQEILRLAYQTKIKPVHYVSTIAVFYAAGQSRHDVIYESDWPEPQNLRGGYMQTKWVAEQLIREAQARGLPGSIYRPGLIGGHSQTGVTNHQDLTSRLVKGSFQLGQYPDRNREFNIVPVDYVSRAIVQLAQQPETLGQVYHLTNPQATQLNQVVNWAGSVGSVLQEVPYRTWRSALIDQFQQGLKNELLPMLPFFSSDRPEQVEQQVDCRNTLQALAGSGIACPPVDANLIKTYVNYMLASGFLEGLSGDTPSSQLT